MSNFLDNLNGFKSTQVNNLFADSDSTKIKSDDVDFSNVDFCINEDYSTDLFEANSANASGNLNIEDFKDFDGNGYVEFGGNGYEGNGYDGNGYGGNGYVEFGGNGENATYETTFNFDEDDTTMNFEV